MKGWSNTGSKLIQMLVQMLETHPSVFSSLPLGLPLRFPSSLSKSWFILVHPGQSWSFWSSAGGPSSSTKLGFIQQLVQSQVLKLVSVQSWWSVQNLGKVFIGKGVEKSGWKVFVGGRPDKSSSTCFSAFLRVKFVWEKLGDFDFPIQKTHFLHSCNSTTKE